MLKNFLQILNSYIGENIILFKIFFTYRRISNLPIFFYYLWKGSLLVLRRAGESVRKERINSVESENSARRELVRGESEYSARRERVSREPQGRVTRVTYLCSQIARAIPRVKTPKKGKIIARCAGLIIYYLNYSLTGFLVSSLHQRYPAESLTPSHRTIRSLRTRWTSCYNI